MERVNLSAFTPIEHPYPPYVSINREEDGRVSIAVRSKADGENCGATSVIHLSAVQAVQLFSEAQMAIARLALDEPMLRAGSGG